MQHAADPPARPRIGNSNKIYNIWNNNDFDKSMASDYALRLTIFRLERTIELPFSSL